MSRYLFNYSANYQPSAPVAEVILLADTGLSESVIALIDTGADATTVPVYVLQRVRARYGDRGILVGVTGNRQVVGIYPLTIQIGSETLYGINVAGYGDEVILGRDVLNQLVVTLDGPGLATEIQLE